MKKDFYKNIISSIVVWGFAISVIASPAKPGLQTVKLADGTTLNVTRWRN